MRRASTWAVALLLSLGGCAGEGPPTGGDGAIPQGVPEQRYGAPTIASPRDLTPLAETPCAELLPDATLRGLDYSPPGAPYTDVLGNETCLYSDHDSRREVRVTIDLTSDLFVGSYQNRPLPLFTPTEIAGLPAVTLKTEADSLLCTTTVGASDRQTVSVDSVVESDLDGAPRSDPCDDGLRVAEAVVATLPPA